MNATDTNMTEKAKTQAKYRHFRYQRRTLARQSTPLLRAWRRQSVEALKPAYLPGWELNHHEKLIAAIGAEIVRRLDNEQHGIEGIKA
jgi:hypothetical protein